MKLAILVVYLVTADTGALIDLQLKMIKRYTKNYTIYACINRLLPEFHDKLKRDPRVTICSIPETSMRGSAELSYYLEHMAQQAIDEGATHLVTMHVDSFPVSAGWEEFIAGKLSAQCVLAAPSEQQSPRMPSAALFFTREFYLHYKPVFRIADGDYNSPAIQLFKEKYRVYSWDSGMGYIYQADTAGLEWYPLERMGKRGGAACYADLIFHLEGGYRYGSPAKEELSPLRKVLRKGLYKIKYAVLPLMPKDMVFNRNSCIRKLLAGINRKMIINSLYAEEKKNLLKDPEQFLKNLEENKQELHKIGRK